MYVSAVMAVQLYIVYLHVKYLLSHINLHALNGQLDIVFPINLRKGLMTRSIDYVID